MATITAQMVKDLRARTDLPMMECKQALSEANGDIEAAVEWLRQKHKGKLAERSERATGEGCIAVFIDPSGTKGGIVELQCETAPVAKNELFTDLGKAFARKTAEGSDKTPDVAALKADPALEKQFTEVFGKMRENMNLTRARRMSGGYLCSYVHHDGKSGVLIALDKAPKSDKAIGADLCMHTLFTQPLAISREGVAREQVEKVREQAKAAALEEGKPAQIVDKIVEGKVNSFYGERVLMEQLHVKTDDYGKAKIADILKEAGVNAITDMVLMRVGV